MGARIERRFIYMALWASTAVTLAVSYAYAGLVIKLIAELNLWADQVSSNTVYKVNTIIIGPAGCGGVLVVCLVVYSVFSIFTLVLSLCTKKENVVPGFRYGALTGLSFLMVAVCLMCALALDGAQFLANGNWVTKVAESMGGIDPDNSSMGTVLFPDESLFNWTTAVAYITASLFFLTFVVLFAYQLAIGCGCFKDSEPDKNGDKKGGPPTAEPAV
mmetsp:Transcript_19906/g.55359  ORF Transcript_19906/g.55359 Transcript_19906/m.55359 type:complete len:217 (-) Transcript_19906:262-912(-)|eukprot:CAMPEP_0117668070 /NCGR_PEP_ID=MMETSP0804-20121206/11326_1 /TAXON_ID=1074897 /ORGANISM="Tetraselmis astigmatica, Strain CCMP880" /LENGTH=216 /DNA_ID=CAMNT_0005475883 /DNA_START=368 /DNA_END=1018 /DNA_ORIENTATION=-